MSTRLGPSLRLLVQELPHGQSPEHAEHTALSLAQRQHRKGVPEQKPVGPPGPGTWGKTATGRGEVSELWHRACPHWAPGVVGAGLPDITSQT